MNIMGDTMTYENDVCECCGEHAKLHWGGLVVGGRDYGQCRICDDCAISNNEYNALVAELADELVAMIDNAINNNDVHPDDVARATRLNIAELDAIERGIDTLETIEHCEYCGDVAFAICVDCDATMCKRHTVISIDDGEPTERCFRCAGILSRT